MKGQEHLLPAALRPTFLRYNLPFSLLSVDAISSSPRVIADDCTEDAAAADSDAIRYVSVEAAREELVQKILQQIQSDEVTQHDELSPSPDEQQVQDCGTVGLKVDAQNLSTKPRTFSKPTFQRPVLPDWNDLVAALHASLHFVDEAIELRHPSKEAIAAGKLLSKRHCQDASNRAKQIRYAVRLLVSFYLDEEEGGYVQNGRRVAFHSISELNEAMTSFSDYLHSVETMTSFLLWLQARWGLSNPSTLRNITNNLKFLCRAELLRVRGSSSSAAVASSSILSPTVRSKKPFPQAGSSSATNQAPSAPLEKQVGHFSRSGAHSHCPTSHSCALAYSCQ